MKQTDFNRRIVQLRLTASRLTAGLEGGNYRSLFKGFGLEFQEVRNYVAGDDPRLIDWKVSSRIGETYSKVYQEERELKIFMILDLSSSMFCGGRQRRKIDQLIELFALIGFSAAQNGDRIGSMFFNDKVTGYFPPRKDRSYISLQLNHLLQYCQHNNSRRKSNLALACRTAYERSNRRGCCIIISDFRCTDYQNQMALLSRRHDLLLLSINDIFDYELPDVGLYNFRDIESGELVSLIPASPHCRHSYSRYWLRKQQQLEEFTRRYRIPYYQIKTDDSIMTTLLRLFSSSRSKK